MQTLQGGTDGNPIYEYDHLSSANMQHLEQLHKAVYGKAPLAQHYTQKYSVVFPPMPPAGLLVYSAGAPVGFMGAIPCRLLYNGSFFWAVQLVDGMVHPDHRGNRTYARLVNTICDLYTHQGASIIFGFPNQNTFQQLRAQPGWVHSGDLDRFTLKVLTLPVARLCARSGCLAQLYSRYLHTVLSKYKASDTMLNSVIVDGYAGMNRDDAYMRYKSASGCNVVLFRAAKVWLKMNAALFIGDVECAPQYFDQLMKDLGRFAFTLGIDTIHFQASPGTSLHQLLTLHGTAVKGFPVLVKQTDDRIPLEKVKFTFADIDVF